METFAKYAERYLDGSLQKISQRVSPCTCGCEGKDPWHAKNIKRVVKEIEVFQSPHNARRNEYTVNICAVGRYKHPAGWMPCGLEVNKHPDGTWIVYGWVQLKHIDYGSPETVVNEGEYVPWNQRPENQKYFS